MLIVHVLFVADAFFCHMLYVHYIAKCMWTGLAILSTHMRKQIFLFQHDKGLVILVRKGSTQQTRIHSLFKAWGVRIKKRKQAHIPGPHATFGHVVHVAMLI